MVRKTIIRLVAVASILLLPAVSSAADVKGKKLRILHVMSYHSPWRWTDGQLDGFKEALTGLDVEYKVFQMDTKRNSSEEAKNKVGAAARALIESWKPDLVYTTDDDAQKYVARHYVGSRIPFVFSGVNRDPADYGFAKSPNVTGVMEHEHSVESVRLLKEMVPNARRIAVIFDDDPMWVPVLRRMKDKAAQLPDVEFVGWDVIRTFKEYQDRIKSYQKRADAVALIGVFTFKDGAGKNVPYQTVLRWTAENSRLPDFSFWLDRVHYGTLCAVTVSEREQGLAAGRMARSILAEGKSPSSIPMSPTTKGIPVVSLARAKTLGIKVKSGILLSGEVIREFDWKK